MPTLAKDRIAALLAGPDPLTWVFTGDSITHGAAHTRGARSYVEHIAERVRWEMQRRRDVIINTGISGERAPGLLADLEHRVLRFKPDIVSLMIGMNDCADGPAGRAKFQQALGQLLEQMSRATRCVILLHTPNAITPWDEQRQDLPAYVEIVRQAARERDVILIDQHKHWSERKEPITYLLEDGTIHPNAAGHVWMTHLTLQAIGIFDPQSAVGRFYVP